MTILLEATPVTDISTFVSYYFPYILIIVAGLIAWKKGFLKDMVESSTSLLASKTKELENCQRELTELKEYNRLLHRDAIVKAELGEEDKRTIKDLKDEIWKLKK